MNALSFTLITGVGATALLDLWGLLRKPLLGLPVPSYAPIGRWVGHMPGRFRHASIAQAAPVRGEAALGWIVHYATGIAFASLPVAIGGERWMQQPTFGLAMAVGLGTLAAPFLLMQPAMGAGIAASRTPNPVAARLQALLTHTVFGLGLYAAAVLTQFV